MTIMDDKEMVSPKLMHLQKQVEDDDRTPLDNLVVARLNEN